MAHPKRLEIKCRGRSSIADETVVVPVIRSRPLRISDLLFETRKRAKYVAKSEVQRLQLEVRRKQELLELFGAARVAKLQQKLQEKIRRKLCGNEGEVRPRHHRRHDDTRRSHDGKRERHSSRRHPRLPRS